MSLIKLKIRPGDPVKIVRADLKFSLFNGIATNFDLLKFLKSLP